MILYYNNVRSNAKNALYPMSTEINSTEDLEKVVSFDHVCAEYKDNYRKNDNFIFSNCSMFDVDNADSDNSEDWISPGDVQKAFPNVPFYVSYSRNHMKPKNNKVPRPKFHIYFPDIDFTDKEEYKNHKNKVCNYFSAFDRNAKDTARFFFGVEKPQVEYYDGYILLSDFMKTVRINENQMINNTDIISEGQRNSTLHAYALKTLTRYGNTNCSYNKYIEESKKCSPLLDEKEVKSIWNSAVKYFDEVISKEKDYILPEQYNKSLKPTDFTDVGQARVFKREYGNRVRYSLSTNYLVYNGKVWLEDRLIAQRLVQELTDKQLKDAKVDLNKAQIENQNALINDDEQEKMIAQKAISNAEIYRNCILKYRDTRRISAVLTEAQPMLQIDVEQLDSDCFKLNTPKGTVNLKTKEISPNNPADFCTKITATSPDNKGAKLFKEFLEDITCKDTELEQYLQIVAGMCAIGKVYCENLIIAYGCGKNGKSTFFNLLSKVMGSYSGSLSSETLTTNCRKNKSYEYAELRGKRLVISSELEYDTKLDTALLKKLCSTDTIYAEKKYKDPFEFTPSHTLVLHTNHLPYVSALDNGTWRRLIVIPFNAVIDNTNEIKNYTDYLFKNAGGAVLSWIIDGAYKFIQSEFKIALPEVAKQAIKDYRSENDWLNNYISQRCEVEKAFMQKSGELYEDYRNYCTKAGEHVLSNSTFNKALESAGYKSYRNSTGRFICGLRLKKQMSNYRIQTPMFNQMTDNVDDIENFSKTEIEF